MQFEFSTAEQILFGVGMFVRVPELAKGFGKRVMLITGRRRAYAAELTGMLTKAGIQVESLVIANEPTLSDIELGVLQARETGCEVMIGLGGGSAMDASKAIGALAANTGKPLDYLEVVGAGKPLTAAPLPVIAIPTTAGTGSEVTRNAVITVPEAQVKVSLRHLMMLPQAAVVDPELTLSLPPAMTARTGMDALTQVIEPYVSRKANVFTDGICREGISRAARALPRAFGDGDDLEARTGMSLVSLYGGLALANAGLGAVHGFAAPLGGMYPISHGTACAAMLAPVMRMNLGALQAREPENPTLERYADVARWLTGYRDAAAMDGVVWVEDLCQKMQIPRLSALGITDRDLPLIASKAAAANSMKANPISLGEEALIGALREAL